MFECVHAMAHEWRSEDNLRCQFLASTLFETEFHGHFVLKQGFRILGPVSTSQLTRDTGVTWLAFS